MLTTTPDNYSSALLNLNYTTYDVVIYSGTIAGINAAYTAASKGCTVALVEPTAHLGGMSGAGGLGNIDLWQTNVIGGIFWQEFQQMAVAEGTDTVNGKKWPMTDVPSTTSSDNGYINPTAPGQLTPQPKTITAVLNRVAQGLLNPGSAISGITVFYNAPLATVAGSVYPSVVMASGAANSAISHINTAIGPFYGTVFIDASYEGDLMAAVAQNTGGTSYAVGRESTSAYSETLAGVSPGSPTLVSGATFPLYPIIANPSRVTGAADNAIQPYNYRATIMTVANGGKAFTAPAGYSASLFASVAQFATAGSYTALGQVVTLNAIEGNKYCMNDVSGGLPLCMINQNLGYPDGTPTQRAAIVAAHKAFYQGILYFAAHDPSMPSAVNTNAQLYGLAPDEFIDNSNWPYQMYIREGRRMVDSNCDATGPKLIGTVGAGKVMTQADVTNGATQTHPICRTSYVMDIHTPLVYSTDATHYVQDGTQFITSGYGTGTFVPMESLIPATGGCPNLIVPVCIGATHIAWGPTRMEPTFAMMGEAAGLMAYRVAKGGDSNVQSITYSALTTLLTAIHAKYT